jgi:hypothetical protein
MGSYISSNANRFYTVLESSYGQVGAVAAENRFPAVKLGIKQQAEVTDRRDKTGSRTFVGIPSGGRRKTTFDLKTYLTSWDKAASGGPAYLPLFHGALGGNPQTFAGAPAGAGTQGATLVFGAGHNLSSGQALAYAGEIRFVRAVVNSTAVLLNAPFTTTPAAGATIGGAVTLAPATELPSVSIFDYWSPSSAVQRILCGAAVDRMEVKVNGDFHEASFSGFAQDLLDSSSFDSEAGGLQNFPQEPGVSAFDYSLVPGHMGQVWLGSSPERFYTLTSGTIVVDNDLDARGREFGSSVARAISPGRRTVTAAFELFSQDDSATASLCQAAKQQSPIEVMLQLGEVEGQLLGVYLKSVVPEVPEFDDGDRRLQWKFRPSRAQGTTDDEIAVAFA